MSKKPIMPYLGKNNFTIWKCANPAKVRNSAGSAGSRAATP